MKQAIKVLKDELIVTEMSIYHADKNRKHIYKEKKKDIVKAIKILEEIDLLQTKEPDNEMETRHNA